MRRQPLEVQHLHAASPEDLQQRGLGGAGIAVEQHQRMRHPPLVERAIDQPAIALISALDILRAPADLAQHPGKRPRPLAAAPAIDQRPPAARLVLQHRLDMARGIVEHQRGTDLAGAERAVLLVEGADARALLVVEHGQVDRAGQVILGVFGGAAHVDHGIVIVVEQVGQGLKLSRHGPLYRAAQARESAAAPAGQNSCNLQYMRTCKASEQGTSSLRPVQPERTWTSTPCPDT